MPGAYLFRTISVQRPGETRSIFGWQSLFRFGWQWTNLSPGQPKTNLPRSPLLELPVGHASVEGAD